MSTIHLHETRIIIEDNGNRYNAGESGIYDTGRELSELGTLYRELVKANGRCTGRVYLDGTDGQPLPIGYVFLKRRKYADEYQANPRERGSYLRVRPGSRFTPHRIP